MLKFAWAKAIFGVQRGKIESEEDAGLRVVMFGRGLHRAALLVKSLQQQHQMSVDVRHNTCNKRCYLAETEMGSAQIPDTCCMVGLNGEALMLVCLCL